MYRLILFLREKLVVTGDGDGSEKVHMYIHYVYSYIVICVVDYIASLVLLAC